MRKLFGNLFSRAQGVLRRGTVVTLCSVIVVGAGVAIFYACNKNDNELGHKSIPDCDCQDVNYQGILTVAENHNRYLDEIFENFDFSSTNPMQELENSIYAANLDGLSHDEKAVILEKFQANDFETTTTDDLINIINQSNIYNNKERVIELITSINENHFDGGMSEINSRIEEIQNTAINELTSVEDISVVLLYTEVLRKSAEYWLPAELGGNGFGYNILATTYKGRKASEGARNAAKVAAADAGSMAAGFTVAAFVCAIFPPAGVGTVIAVVAEGAIASAAKGISIAVKK